MMKNKYFSILSLCFLALLYPHSIRLASQEFDQKFLDSLPENLKVDFENALTQDTGEENIYSPDSRIKKLEESLKEAERNLTNIRTEMDKNSKDISSDALQRYGKNFFSTYQSSFLPINEPNPSSDYFLDFGDKLNIQVVGQLDDEFDVAINRDGSIYIPKVGSILVGGLSLNDAIKLIRNKISDSYIGVESYISLSELRDMNVLIVGNAFTTGMFTLPGGSSPLSLIAAAGGIGENGSFRNIVHKRNNEIIQTIDLYEVLAKGNINFAKNLRSGDVLVVNPKGGEVKIDGGVANPAIYEFIDGESLGDILEIAGVFNPYDQKKIIRDRFDGVKIFNQTFTLKEITSQTLVSGDSISVINIQPDFNSNKTVVISGEVNLPGTYTVGKNTTLSQLILQAGSYTSKANPFGGVHIRKSIVEKEKESVKKSYNDLVKFLVASGSNVNISDSYLTFLALIKDYQPSGRIISDFNIDNLRANPSLDRILQDGDKIHIPYFQNDIYIFGEVMNPGSQVFHEDLTFQDYILNAGSLSRSADPNRIVIVYPNGQARLIENSLFKSLQKKHEIYPGSIIYVPRYIGKVDGIDLAATVAPILSSLAISLASLNSISN